MLRALGFRPVGSLLAALVIFTAHAAEAHRGRPAAPPLSLAEAPAALREPTASFPAPVAPVTDGAPAFIQAGAPAPPLWLVAAALVGLGGACIRPFRRLVLSLQAVILLAFVAESGVHSVHHLTDPNGATACQVLSVSQQVTGDLPTSALVPREPAVAGLLVVPTTPPIPADAPQRPDRGRAPPVPA